MTRLLTADPDPASTWVLAGWAVLVIAFIAALLWSCYRAWKDREEPTDE